MIDSGLLDFATSDKQREKIEAFLRLGTTRKAAVHLDVDVRQVQKAIQSAQDRAAIQGYAPSHDMTHTAPSTHVVKGVSTLYGDNGQIVNQWVKTDLRREALEAELRAVIDAMRDDIPKAKPVKSPTKASDPDLLNLFVITDFHMGALGWGEETRGEDWDSTIAENLLSAWFDVAVSESPNAETAVFAQLGDFLHLDSLDAVTPTSRHLLDSDTRYQRVVRVAIRVLRRVVAKLLAKHNRVIVVMAEGNHDIASSAWLREVFAAFYADEPRVTVDTSPDPYYCYEHGLTSLFFHHGHLKKLGKGLDATFAGKFRDVFGRTKYSYAHTGHYHHFRAEETALMTIQQHRTLAASDAYSSRAGYVSGRDAEVITYSREYGKVGSITISPHRARACA